MPLYPTKYATDSRVNSKMLEFYRARAQGGVGLIVLDCPCLDYPRAYKGPHELRIDRPEYSDTVAELLKAEGYALETAASPAGILAALEERQFDVVLMDLNYTRDTTSGEEGLDLLGRIQALDPLLPVW